MTSTFLKCYTHDEYRNILMYHYCYIRLNNILPSDYSIHNASPVTTPYYDTVINTIRNVIHLPGFPSTPKKQIYMSMLIKEESLAASQYPTLNWQNIWDNYLSLFIYPFEKEIIYKHLHMCLATNKKLFVMNLIDTSKCNKCTTERDQTPLHMLYECEYVKAIFMWLLRVLHYVSNFKPMSNIKFIYFDNTYRNRQQRNICNLFISAYILTIWKTRKENLRIAILKNMVINKVLEIINIIKYMPNHISEEDLGYNLNNIEPSDLLDR